MKSKASVSKMSERESVEERKREEKKEGEEGEGRVEKERDGAIATKPGYGIDCPIP